MSTNRSPALRRGDLKGTAGAFGIRPAHPSEADELTALVRSSDAYDGRYRVMVANQRLTADYLAANVVRVAHGGAGELYGFYSLLVPGRGAESEGELDFMFVANGLQGRGIGRTMMNDLCGVAEQRRLTRVHVVAHPPAEQFYLTCGAHRVGHLPPAGRVTWTRPHLVLNLPVAAATLPS
jgi:GNAT superfamily N-acetyltransferase